MYPLCLSAYIHRRGRAPQENEGNDFVDYAPGIVDPGAPQAAFPGPSAHRCPALGQPAAANLRRLASRCVHNPGSHVDIVWIEPGTVGDIKW